MQDFIVDLIQHLVDDPDAITIETEVDPQTQAITYHVRVAQEDIGKVVGKEGRIAEALRTVIKSVAMKQKQKVYLNIVAH